MDVAQFRVLSYNVHSLGLNAQQQKSSPGSHTLLTIG